MAPPPRRKLGWYALGFRDRHLKQMLTAAGWDLRFGPTTRDLDAVAIWGDRPVAARGRRAAKQRNLPLLHIEDAPLRAITTAKSDPSVGLTIDQSASYLDVSGNSDLEQLLSDAPPLSDTQRDRATTVMAMLRAAKLSKYNDDSRSADDLPRDFVLVVDQVPGDASIRLGNAGPEQFQAAIKAAKAEHPDIKILIKGHPKANAKGHFSQAQADHLPSGYNIYDVLDRAAAVYVVTSQVGFEAIIAGHRPVVFGQPFYAGWGLSDDRKPIAHRNRALDRETLFARAFIDYPFWFDPVLGRPAAPEQIIEGLIARKRHYGWTNDPPLALGMSQWKRARLRDFLGNCRFVDTPQAIESDQKHRLAIWGRKFDTLSNMDGVQVTRVEDGFLRSRGIGAKLVPPLSLCLDGQGIYYDTNRPNDLADLIAASAQLSPAQLTRAANLRATLTQAGLSKYNQGQAPSDSVDVLVVGQVENDASVLLSGGAIKTNQALLETARRANPDAKIAYKPHPDVEAGLRRGELPNPLSGGLADVIWTNIDPIKAIKATGEVWTMTSLLGFEALLHGVKVTTTGRPFYAGWGLTTDLDPPNRTTKAPLDGLVHATLIDYATYFDPISGLAATPEAIAERLSNGFQERAPLLRLAALAQAVSGWRPNK